MKQEEETCFMLVSAELSSKINSTDDYINLVLEAQRLLVIAFDVAEADGDVESAKLLTATFLELASAVNKRSRWRINLIDTNHPSFMEDSSTPPYGLIR